MEKVTYIRGDLIKHLPEELATVVDNDFRNVECSKGFHNFKTVRGLKMSFNKQANEDHHHYIVVYDIIGGKVYGYWGTTD
jgi:hypothetical protein